MLYWGGEFRCSVIVSGREEKKQRKKKNTNMKECSLLKHWILWLAVPAISWILCSSKLVHFKCLDWYWWIKRNRVFKVEPSKGNDESQKYCVSGRFWCDGHYENIKVIDSRKHVRISKYTFLSRFSRILSFNSFFFFRLSTYPNHVGLPCFFPLSLFAPVSSPFTCVYSW